MFLADAEKFYQEAEQRVVDHRRSLRLRETPRYKEVHARICHLTDIEVEICRSMWNEDGVRVRDCQFDSELYMGASRHEAIFYIESDDVDAAEHYCRNAERVLAGEQLETEL